MGSRPPWSPAGFLRPYDVAEYEHYAHAALQAPLFHRLPLEYPAPALAVFILPLLLQFSYPWAFALLAGIVLLFLVTSYDGPDNAGIDVDAARRLVVYLAVGATCLFTGRYDIFAAAAAFWSFGRPARVGGRRPGRGAASGSSSSSFRRSSGRRS